MKDPIIQSIENDTIILRTERLWLRPFAERDAETVERLLNDKEIASNTRSIPFPFPKGQGMIRIREQNEKWLTGDAYVFAICLSGTEQVVGGIGLEIDKENHHAELGYWLGREFWKNGYCSEVAKCLVEFGFETLGLYRIHAHHLTRNPASGRVLGKIGMRKEGLLRGHSRKWGVFEDIVVYGMLATDPR